MKKTKIKIEWIGTGDLKPLDNNPRKTVDDQTIEKLKNLIEAHGFMNPLTVWKRGKKFMILCGNHRFEAGIQLGMDSFPCVLFTGTRKEAIARAISDNKSSEWTEWDIPSLKDYFADLDDGEFDMGSTGFEFGEIESLFCGGEVDEIDGEDEAGALPKKPKTRGGDVYLLGSHKLTCGDATSQKAVEDLVCGGLVDMLFTDPPYGVNYTGKTKEKLRIQNDGDAGAWERAIDLIPIKPGGSAYVCCPPGNNFVRFEVPFQARYHHASTIIWNKNAMVLGHSDYHFKHEPILYGWRLGGSHKFYGDRAQVTVWDIDKPSRSGDHPTMKPVALIEKAILNSTKKGQAIFDPFGGSGSTLIAAQKTGRRCFLMEIDPGYCDVIVNRFKSLFPEEAVEHIPAGGVKCKRKRKA